MKNSPKILCTVLTGVFLLAGCNKGSELIDGKRADNIAPQSNPSTAPSAASVDVHTVMTVIGGAVVIPVGPDLPPPPNPPMPKKTTVAAPNVSFTITDSNQKVTRFTTGSDGSVLVTLAPGTFAFQAVPPASPPGAVAEPPVILTVVTDPSKGIISVTVAFDVSTP